MIRQAGRIEPPASPRTDPAAQEPGAIDGGRGAARLWEIDALRVVAMILMVAYHAAYDVNFLSSAAAVDPYDGFWRGLQVVCGSLFLTVVGISFWVSDARGRARGLTGRALWRSHLLRGFEILAAAALVSVATRIALGAEDAVRFGILHLIAVLVLFVLPVTARLGRWAAALGVCVAVAGLLLEVRSNVPGAMVLGFIPADAGVDWYPLMPWSGAALVGLALGSALYPEGRRGALAGRLPAPSEAGLRLAGAGRHSLPFYLVHQPVLIAVVAAVLWVSGVSIDMG